jgi:uncharacterized protein (UPF0210 family)
MDEMNTQEKAYVELIKFLDTKLEENEKNDISGYDDYENGFLDGESEMIKELIMKMQKEVIGWHY